MAAKRLSSYSNLSSTSRAQATSVSTQTLLNSLHTAYSERKPYTLDSTTSLVVNTWLTAATEGLNGRQGGTVDPEVARRAWEHARRRAEDGCIVLGSLHESTPPLFGAFVAALPINTPNLFFNALAAIQPFLQCVTPQNPQSACHSALSATLTLSLSGNLAGLEFKLANSGIDVSKGLLNIPAQPGYRAFDVFYYLLSSASTQSERDNLGLLNPSQYALLRKSDTYDPPAFLPTADDAAAAEELRANLKAIGITGSARRDLLTVLAAILKLGNVMGFLVDEDVLESTCDEVGELLDIDSEILLRKCSTSERELLIAGLYEGLVDWVISKANEALAAEVANNHDSETNSRAGAMTPVTSDDHNDTVALTIVEIPSHKLGKAAAMRNVFDDTEGINAEMKQDGVPIIAAGHSVLDEMKAAVREHEPELGIRGTPAAQQHESELDRREALLDKVGQEIDDEESFVKRLIYPVPGEGISLGRNGRFDLSTVLGCSRVWFHLSLHPTDELPAKISSTSPPWSAGSPSRQLRSWRLPEWANRRNRQLDFTSDFDTDEFCARYSRLGCKDGKDGIESFILERGWSNGEVVIGTERIWIREAAWWEAENMLDMVPVDTRSSMPTLNNGNYPMQNPAPSFYASPFGDDATIHDSRDNLLLRNQSSATRSHLGGRSLAPTTTQTMRNVSGGDYGLGHKGDDKYNGASAYLNELDPELADPKVVVQQPITTTRRIWSILVWCLTWPIPSFVLRYVGRMKRPDVRMAWREKLVLVALIVLLNGIVVFYIIVFGRLLCPNFDKAWNIKELSYHQGDTDFYVGVRGKTYDISKFWKLDHSHNPSFPVTQQVMQPLAGKVVDPIFPIPFSVACRGLTSDETLQLQFNDTNNQLMVNEASFSHRSGRFATDSNLRDPNWFNTTFLPAMKEYYKGDIVFKRSDVSKDGENNGHMWFIINGNVYDLTDYFHTQDVLIGDNRYNFIDSGFEELVKKNPGSDLTAQYDNWKESNATAAGMNYACLNNAFYVGKTDFRDTARCMANNYILLAFTIVLCAVILVKFLSALQLGSKRRPSPQDKFVICQVPAYTEGEDQLRKGLDSLTALAYDNKRKLLCVICDGMIVGGGNDRPTPKIVLDILGVDPKIDPPALPFKSVGEGSEQLNYGKVYSGLYEYEGNVVPYVVIVKVGKESEQNKAKPGNRGKRDSQILLMSFLNRVHHRSPMSPLELEMFHQINNIIGVDPELYEYLFMVDADTQVKEDALNRLVASCANDAKIAGICGETSLENEERSWWTMIQVYEYYISHHLAKAFESLFGSVTCLPGCFCMYRLRTADKGKPLIIADKVIDEYSDNRVDTLHKKNLLALGEDRYLTTLMTKHFPAMRYKFVPDALAHTAAPETWGVLLSQRRRWINSTIHNLAELVFLKDLCGFCCFSMRFVVFIDLFGTLILPATCAYLVYLIYRVASGTGQFPLVSVIMLAAVYGLQAIVFIIKRQWQHIGWMIIYLIAYPIYSVVLPIYSFWKQDDFSWGNTRIVLGEKGKKQIIATEDEGFDPRSIPLQTWDDYASVNNLPGRRGMPGLNEKSSYAGYDDAYEMDDMRSVYSSVKPASTILTGFKGHHAGGMYMPPQSPAPFARPGFQTRQSGLSHMTPYSDTPNLMEQQQARLMSMGNGSEHNFHQPGAGVYSQQRSPVGAGFHSTDNLMVGTPSPPLNRAGRRSPAPASTLGYNTSRPASTVNVYNQQATPNFQLSQTGFGGANEPTNSQIVEAIQACLGSVDLDNVTKKQLKALTEQRLGISLSPERRQFLDHQIDFELANM